MKVKLQNRDKRAVLVLIAGSIPIMRSRPGGLAPIGSDTTEWSPTGSSAPFFSVVPLR